MDANALTMLRFHDVLVRLSSPAEEQIRTKEPGICLACDLVNDHEDASLTFVAMGLPLRQKDLWGSIGAALQAMHAPDLECNNDEVVRRPAWEKVREMAAELLRAFRLQAGKALVAAEEERRT